MSNISKEHFKYRLVWLIILLVLSIIASGIYSVIFANNNIVKTNFSICLNADTKEIFEEQFDSIKKLYKYYNFNSTSDSKSSDLIFTSDIKMIDTSKDYSIEGYSPLVVCLKDTKNLNNYLKTVTKEGFLTCSSSKKIKNSYSDVINCDFLRIIEAVLNGEDWSDLGGEDKKITVYCPEPDTISGNLFYEFLLITINGGKYPTDNLEQVKEKADLFLNSENTIQTDVCSKISKLGSILEEEDIYVLFESDLISATDGQGEISVIYPEMTVIKQLYLQYNDSNLKEKISKSMHQPFYLKSTHCYRSAEYTKLNNTQYSGYYPLYFNVQEGFNYYELTN